MGGFPVLKVSRPPAFPQANRVLVPYDAEGRRLPEGASRWMWLDLNDRQKVRITPGNNIQGARQPQFMHIGASAPVTTKGVTRKNGEGLGVVTRRDEGIAAFALLIEGEAMKIGIWWLEAAARGGPDVLPLVNQRPIFEKVNLDMHSQQV